MKTARLAAALHDREPRQTKKSVPGVRNCAGHRGRTILQAARPLLTTGRISAP